MGPFIDAVRNYVGGGRCDFSLVFGVSYVERVVDTVAACLLNGIVGVIGCQWNDSIVSIVYLDVSLDFIAVIRKLVFFYVLAYGALFTCDSVVASRLTAALVIAQVNCYTGGLDSSDNDEIVIFDWNVVACFYVAN